MEEVRKNIVKKFKLILKSQPKSVKIEDAIYNWSLEKAEIESYSTSWDNQNFRKIYLDKCICIFSNINETKYAKNTYLLNKIKNNDIDISRIPWMNSHELFPEHWKDLEEKQKATDEFKYLIKDTAYTEEYTCPKCRKKKNIINEMQTRSADEPVTIFITCGECNFKWRK